MARAKPSMRLKKTLARKLKFRPIENEDVQYAWVAYKQGALDNIFPSGLDAPSFKDAFESLVITRFHAAWTFFADTHKGFIPAGFAFGYWPHHQEQVPFMILDSLSWFPWASPRNKLESAVNFLTNVRKDIPMMFFVDTENKKFVETVARHGILNRVGTSYISFPGERASIWETRGT